MKIKSDDFDDENYRNTLTFKSSAKYKPAFYYSKRVTWVLFDEIQMTGARSHQGLFSIPTMC